mgnify:CR=1 FL=1
MKNVKVNSTQGYVLTLEGVKELKHNKSIYDNSIKNEIKEICKFNNLDLITFEGIKRKLNANESTYLREQLTALIGESLSTWYPDNTARSIFDVNSMNIPGAKSLKYTQKAWNGTAKVVTDDDNDDMPLVGGSKTPFYSPVYELQLGAKFSLQDLESAALGMEPLEADRVLATRWGHERAFNNIAFGIGHLGTEGDPNSENIPGLFNQTTKCILAADDSALTNDNMLGNTGPENRDFLLGVINSPFNFTEKADSIPDTLVMPIAQANKINSQALSADNNDTVAKYILNNTSIKKIIASPECKNVGINSITDALFCFNSTRQARIAQIQETMPYRQYQSQLSGFNYLIPTRSRNAGLFIFKKAIALVKNCGA